MPLIIPANTLVPSGYDVENSIRLDGSAYMHKTQSGGNRQIFTMSCWTKLTGAYGSNAGSLLSTDGTDDDSNFHFGVDNGGGSGGATDSLFLHIYGADGFTTTPFLRDYAAWYHVVLAVDTTQSTSSNRMKLYVNNVQQTLTEGSDYPAQNDNFGVNESGTVIGVGTHPGSVATYALNSYLAEYCLIDGLQLTPSSFGEANEDSPTIWQPIDVSGLTFGTNGFYLDFEDSANLGNDANGGTDLTEVNLAAADQATDTPTNNFCTLNPLLQASDTTLSEGNLNYSDTNSNFKGVTGTIAVTSGKWYCETKVTTVGDAHQIGIVDVDQLAGAVAEHPGSQSRGWSLGNERDVYNNNGILSGYDDWTAAYGNGNIVGCALDLDNNKLYFSMDGEWSAGDGSWGSTTFNASTAAIPITGGYYYVFCNSAYNGVASMNFGSPSYANSSSVADENGYGDFEFAPPSGFYSLNTKNLAEYG